jgi:hypothetical protein
MMFFLFHVDISGRPTKSGDGRCATNDRYNHASFVIVVVGKIIEVVVGWVRTSSDPGGAFNLLHRHANQREITPILKNNIIKAKV